MYMCPIQVHAHPHGFKLSPSETYHLQEAFFKGSWPPRRQKRPGTDRNHKSNIKKNSACHGGMALSLIVFNNSASVASAASGRLAMSENSQSSAPMLVCFLKPLVASRICCIVIGLVLADFCAFASACLIALVLCSVSILHFHCSAHCRLHICRMSSWLVLGGSIIGDYCPHSATVGWAVGEVV